MTRVSTQTIVCLHFDEIFESEQVSVKITQPFFVYIFQMFFNQRIFEFSRQNKIVYFLKVLDLLRSSIL
jgi:hypothetical protein